MSNQEIDVSVLIAMINDTIEEACTIANKINRGLGFREMTLCVIKLEEARHRAIDAMMLLQGGHEPQEVEK